MKQEFTPPLFKAKSANSKNDEWIESITILKGSEEGGLFMPISIYQSVKINPSTLCMDSGLTAERVVDGIDPKIWSGDLFQAETVAGIRTWKVIYKDAAFYVQRTDDEEIETLLFNFISDNVYTKIGSIHENEGK